MGSYYSRVLYDCENPKNMVLHKKYKNDKPYDKCLIIAGLEYLEIACNYNEIISRIHDQKGYFILGFEKSFLFYKPHISHIYVKYDNQKLLTLLSPYGQFRKKGKNFIFYANCQPKLGQRILIYNIGDHKIFDYRYDQLVKIYRDIKYTVVVL